MDTLILWEKENEKDMRVEKWSKIIPNGATLL